MDMPDDLQDHGPAFVWHTYKTPIILGGVSVFLAVLSLVLLIKSTQTATPIQFSRTDDVEGISTQSGSSANLGTILVDIEGSVVRPGVIRLPVGSRVEDAIQAAGGLQKSADAAYIAQYINRAMKVADGMKIYIPEAGETITSYNTKLNNTAGNTSHNLDSLSRRPDGQSYNESGSVSINFASKSQLDSLPGVGPVTAQKIMDNRPYASLDELVKKKAIGPSLFEKLKNSLTL